METLAVIGAGMMGPGIAQVFATRGHTVRVQDLAEDRLASVTDRVRANLVRMAAYGLVDDAAIPAILARIEVTSDSGGGLRRGGCGHRGYHREYGGEAEHVRGVGPHLLRAGDPVQRSEEHTSELQ